MKEYFNGVFKNTRIFRAILSFITAIGMIFSLFTGIMNPIEPSAEIKNIIIMIGDGMGENHLNKAKQELNIDLAMDTFPIQGYSKTRSTSIVTDSAAGATALSCGVRTINGYIGVYPEDPLNYCYHPMNVTELAMQYGKKTGIVTSDENTGATPAGFSAHTDSRSNSEIIADQQAVSGIDLIWSMKSDATDTALVQANGYTLITDKAGLASVTPGTKSFGQFGSDVWMSPENAEADTPTLSLLTEKAISTLDNDDKGFFLMVEGAHIDKKSHKNEDANMVEALAEFDDSVKVALDFAKEDGETMIIIVADHETGAIKLKDGKYQFTSGSHSNANVPLRVYGSDNFIKNGDVVMNKQVAQFMAMSIDNSITEFPIKVYSKAA